MLIYVHVLYLSLSLAVLISIARYETIVFTGILFAYRFGYSYFGYFRVYGMRSH